MKLSKLEKKIIQYREKLSPKQVKLMIKFYKKHQLKSSPALKKFFKEKFPEEYAKLSALKRKYSEVELVQISRNELRLLAVGLTTCEVCKAEGNLKPSPTGSYLCSRACSAKYALKLMEKSNLKIYGTKNIFSSKYFKKNKVKFLQRRYGKNVTAPTLVPGAREKIKATTMKRYGEEHSSRVASIKRKARKTSIERYGVSSYLATKKCREEMKKAALSRYGVPHQSMAEENKKAKSVAMLSKTKKQRLERLKKSKATSLKRYGVEFAIQNPKVHERISRKRSYKIKWRGKSIVCQGCEKRLLKNLESDKKVLNVFTKRKKVGVIPYRYKGRNKIYYPDILIVRRGGKLTVVEAKSNYWLGVGFNKKLLNPNKAKFRAATKYYKKKGVEFVLVIFHNSKFHWVKNPGKNLTRKVKNILSRN